MRARVAVGNDVVDVDDPAIARHHERDRFVQRVCGEAERQRLAATAEPHALLWSLFAAKEAAYKVVAKLGPPPAFAHRRFAVAADLRAVQYGDLSVRLAIERGPGFVHAVAWLGPAPACAHVEPVADGDDPRAAVRRSLCAAIAPALGCEPQELQVVRDPLPGGWTDAAPPRLTRNGRPLDVDISLSHDGRYIAYAATRTRESLGDAPPLR